jgi:acyl carrier protein
MAVQSPLSILWSKVVLGEYLDSLSKMEFIMLMEKIHEIKVDDEDAENLITFQDTVYYVQRQATNS